MLILNRFARHRGILVLACSMLLGCGGDDGGAQGDSCFIDVGVTGAVEYEQTHRDLFCLYPTSLSEGISTMFIPYEEEFDRITLEVDGITEGEVGTFPATLTFAHQDGRDFRSDDCEVTVESHEPDGEDTESGLSYLFRGTGTCASPAASLDNPSETLTVSEFEFVSGVIWAQ